MSQSNLKRGVVQFLENLRGHGVTHLPLTPQQLQAAIDTSGVSSVKQVAEKPARSTSADSVKEAQESKPIPLVDQGKPSKLTTSSAPPATSKPAEKKPPVSPPSAAASASKKVPVEPVPSANILGQPPLPLADREQSLTELAEQVAACTKCSALCNTRTQTVFGVGNMQPRLVFLGEAPGGDEDRLGEPFVGRAGQLLTDIIEKGMKIKRSDVYILNILKCRPPGNRNPEEDEALSCRPFLNRQLEILRPDFICCLGSVAAQNLLSKRLSVGLMRGRFHDFQGVKVMVTYHPAYLLRNPSAKKLVWEDVQMLMREMDLE